ncbi:MAG: di-heme-cytochrome C peroxidase [Saprospiraceae bacterium]|nr:di-heme-cytochrome C peroxidase [Saprospiraceae bacterium]
MKKGIIVFLFLALFTVCCNLSQDLVLPKDVKYVTADGQIPDRKLIVQGWTDDQRDKFWFTSQGSQIMPYSWFTWLEQADNSSFFRNTSHMESLGYLPMATSKDNPSGLPIGFAMTRAKSAKDSYVGLTCAACHTNQLNYKGTSYLIDGAPTLANFVAFYDAIVASLNATYEDDSKFNRFSLRVLGQEYSKAKAKSLRKELLVVATQARQRQEVNALPLDYPEDFTSFARLDAFGNIENAGSAFALGDLTNKNSPAAPVSYPFLWGTHQSDVVQWTASASNTPIVGPLVRNAGEVVGVFGGLTIKEANWLKRLFGIKHSYQSTIDFHGLGALEGYVKVLRSPRWESTNFPPIDKTLMEKGKKLYEEHCTSCHEVIDYEDEMEHYKSIKTPLLDVQTDPMTAWSVPNHMAKTLILEGSKADIVVGKRFGPTTRALDIPINGIVGMVLKNPIKSLEAGIITSQVKGKSWEELVDDHAAAMDSVAEDNYVAQGVESLYKGLNVSGLVYKARPLNGIWATAPYLHNGSIPNLWALLQPENERPTKFHVGSREFVPDSVGYVTGEGPSVFSVLKSDGTEMMGNSNLGHTYGTELPDDDKWALIEYMKSL